MKLRKNINTNKTSPSEATTTASSFFGDNDSIMNTNNDITVSQQSNPNVKRRNKRSPLQKLKLLRNNSSSSSKANSISEARKRAAQRNIPPSFTTSKLSRLQELKEAKLRAEERHINGSGSISIASSSIRTTDTTTSVMSVNGIEVQPIDDELLLKNYMLTFISSLFIHTTLLQLTPYSNQYKVYTTIALTTLQILSFHTLLNSIFIYTFDNINYGQLNIVKNLEYGKLLYIIEVQKYTRYVSLSIGLISVLIGLGYSLVLNVGIKWGCHLHFMSKMCSSSMSDKYEISSLSWYEKVYKTSTFITTRLSVFTLAVLLLGYVLLPNKKKKKKSTTNNKQKKKRRDENKTLQTMTSVDEESEEDDNDNEDSCNDQQQRRRKHNSNGALTSWSVSFIIATTIAIIFYCSKGVTASSSSSSSSLSPPTSITKRRKSILVAGSLNADTFLPIHRFPSSGENLTLLPGHQPLVDVPGGKGCNQAIACAKLSSFMKKEKGVVVSFLGQFGNDAAASILKSALLDNNVDISSHSGYSKVYPSGRGYVMLVPKTGEVSAVVSGGSNLYGWGNWGVKNNDEETDSASSQEDILTDQDIQDLVSKHSLLLLQCEVPNFVNVRLAMAAHEVNIPVIADVGGEDRPMGRDLLECCDYLIPNETELERLARSFQQEQEDSVESSFDQDEVLKHIQAQIGPSLDLPSIIKSVKTLQINGASNVLVTLGSKGSILFKKKPHSILYQPACPLPFGSSVVDETGAGDCYRAGFVTALLEHNEVNDDVLQNCMKFASAAGALAVTRQGAVPSIPSREEVDELMINTADNSGRRTEKAIPRGGDTSDDDSFPFMFGSRLNSMKDRLDLVDSPMATPRDYVKRQATIQGLGCVDFNYPQHFGDYWTPTEAKKALDEVGLVAGAVCLRYPSKFARGAMNHPDAEMRREAIEITKQAAEAARILGCNEVVVWSAYDGYDYPFQVSYQEKWKQVVSAFRECCDAFPDIKWSLEFKPTDENTRFFTVPSTGAAMLLVKEIDRPNMGLTLDMGHMLMAGENPAQSIQMVGEKLFGIQLNDGYTRLAAEDGMMFGSIHPSIALEAMYQLREINFSGHMYFDTFPQRTDPVKEAEYNIRRVKKYWMAVNNMDSNEIERIAREHDAIGALELVNNALERR